jgi:competence protein ComEC
LLPLLLFWQLRQRSWFPRAVLLCGGLALLCGYGFTPARQPLELVMFSVGQGDAMLLKGEDGRTLLIDGGGLYSDRFDVGERLLAPALGYLGVSKLDAVILTHDHPDHRKGLIFLLKHIPTAAFWTSHRFIDLSPDLRQVLRQQKIPVREFSAGWTAVNLFKHGKLEMFVSPEPKANKNDASLVLYLQRDDQGLLLTGDLEEGGVRALTDAGLPGPVTLLKLPHHGSRFSRSDMLFDQLRPKLSMVSSGYQNRYRLPARQVVEQLIDRQIPLWRTDQQGTLRFILDDTAENGWRVESWQAGLFR